MRTTQQLLVVACLLLLVAHEVVGVSIRRRAHRHKKTVPSSLDVNDEKRIADLAGASFALPTSQAGPAPPVSALDLRNNPTAPITPLNPYAVSTPTKEALDALEQRHNNSRNNFPIGGIGAIPANFNAFAPSTIPANANASDPQQAAGQQLAAQAMSQQQAQLFAQQQAAMFASPFAAFYNPFAPSQQQPQQALQQQRQQPRLPVSAMPSFGMMGAAGYNPMVPTWFNPLMSSPFASPLARAEPNIRAMMNNMRVHNTTELATMANGFGQRSEVWKKLMANNALEGVSLPVNSNNLFYQVPRPSDKSFVPFSPAVNTPVLPVTFVPLSPFQYQPMPPIAMRQPMGKQSGWYYDPRRDPITVTMPSPAVMQAFASEAAAENAAAAAAANGALGNSNAAAATTSSTTTATSTTPATAAAPAAAASTSSQQTAATPVVPTPQ